MAREETNTELTAHSGDGAIDPVASSVDQIRDIIFGREMSAYEQRFALLEKQIQDATEALRADIQQRLDALDAHVKAETKALTNRLTKENEDRNKAFDKVAATDKSNREAIHERIDKVEESGGETADEIRQQLMSETQQAREALEMRSDELRKLMDEQVAAIQHQKTDRETLADLLADMAARLKEGSL